MIKGIFMKYLAPLKPYHTDSIHTEQNEIKCGMRNPSTRGKSDDLSCLTSSSTSSRDQSNAKYPMLTDADNNTAEFNSTYLPQVIDPHEWQQQNVSRKRKERQDSTSSITQDRKVVRSNSEEHLPSIDYEVIRRVSSHEEIKQPNNDIDGVTTPLLQTKYPDDDDLDEYDDDDDDDDYDDDDDETNCGGRGSGSGEQMIERRLRRRPYRGHNNNNNNNNNSCSSNKNDNDDDDDDASNGDIASSTKSTNNEVQEILREAYRRSETSPARSRTFDFSHKLRVSPNRDTNNQTNDALSDFQTMSDRRSSERFCKARAAQGFRKSSSSKKSSAPALVRQSSCSTDSEHNENAYKYDINVMKSERRGFSSSKNSAAVAGAAAAAATVDETSASECGDDLSSSFSDHNDNNDYTDFMPISPSAMPRSPANAAASATTHVTSLPWDYYTYTDEVPVKSQRFADDKFDHVNHTRHIDMKLRNESFSGAIPHFAKGDSLKARDLMKSNPLPNVYTSPDEKLKQINKRLTALKKRVATFDENYAMENGYRPSLSIKLNERYVKNALAEIHKLRKEKQALKSDPMNAMGYKSSPSNDHKVQKMKETIGEIEKRLQMKRMEENRPNDLDELNPEQLVQEKTAVQRALLYLESLYGRPTTRDERDAARSLYNRYRVIKRLVNRSVSISGAGSNNLSELPTILEHEAMAFTVAAISLTPPPSDTEAIGSGSSGGANIQSNILDSSTDSTDTSSSINENVHEMSLDGLTRNLEIVRDEKKKLRRTIKEFEEVFEEQNGRKMLKSDRTAIEETYALYKQKKAKLRLLDALVRKQLTN